VSVEPLGPSIATPLRAVFILHPKIREVILFGSRAKGSARPESDIDLALVGAIDELEAEAVADELEELPLPYGFDVKAYDRIKSPALKEHIARVGKSIYRREGDAVAEDGASGYGGTTP
jgi:predicted nucleotidyltransferase